jgi:hypothetical protein
MENNNLDLAANPAAVRGEASLELFVGNSPFNHLAKVMLQLPQLYL